MKTEVYKISFGIPEKFVPTRFAPSSNIGIREISAEKVPQIRFSVSQRGASWFSRFHRQYGFTALGFSLRHSTIAAARLPAV